MNKLVKLLPILIIFIFSLFASQKLFSDKFYTSHDGGGHIIRMIEFDEALREGQFPVRIAKRINHGLGYPYFNFNYPFIYYLSTGLTVLGLSFVNAFKAILVISLIIGGVSMYFFTRHFFDKTGALVSAIFYTIAPYRFLNMYVRGTVAEVFALGLLPLSFLSIEFIVREKKSSSILFIVVTSLLILSHNITALLALPLVFLYFLFRIKGKKQKRKRVKKLLFGFIGALLLTTFFWLPAVLENRLTKLVELTEDYRAFFPSPIEVLYSPWGFGSYVQGEMPGKMSPQIGLAHLLVVLLAIVIFLVRFSKRKIAAQDGFFLVFIFLAMVTLFLMFPPSIFLWDHVYYLQLVQHPWRLVGYTILSASVAAGYFVGQLKGEKIKFTLAVGLVLFLLYANRNHIRVNQYIEFENPFLVSEVYGPSTTSKDEHMPRLAPRVYETPNQNGDIFPSSAGQSKRIVWKSNYHAFDLLLKADANFRDNTSYFPGWVGQIDGKETEILYEEDGFRRLLVHVPEGTHKVEFLFKETWYRQLADIVSVSALAGFLLILWKRKKLL